MPIGPTGSRFRRIGGSFQMGGTISLAALTTALTGTNNDLTYTSKATGNNYSSGNNIRVRYVVAGNNTALSVSVSGSDITVNVATDGSGNPTSTAAQVRTAVLASAPAAALVDVALAAGNDGTGVVVALAFTSLSGASDYTLATGR